MRKIALFALLGLFSASINAQNNYTQYVNPFVGTAGHGHTFPGATLPFAMVQLSPDTRIDGSWDGCSGYHYSDTLIYGFSHTHLSGTGCSDYGDINFMPTFVSKPVASIAAEGKLSYTFNHRTEKASPGYYTVTLNNGIQVELSATTRAGIQKYTYQQKGYAWITLDLNHRDKLIEGLITKIDAQTFSGFRRSKAWAEDQLVYFYTQINKPADQVLIKKDTLGNYRMHLGYWVKAGESILVKTSISSVDEKGAENNLKKELNHWDFNLVKRQADQAWNTELNRIQAFGGSQTERQNFYTALYHCMIHPNIMNDVDGKYRGHDKKVHQADGFNYYTVFSLWDTYRALHPLLNIIDNKRSHDFMMTFKAQYEQGGRLPMWELWGNETNCMIGFHSVSVIWNAYLRGVINIKELADLYPAIRAEAMNNRTGLDVFRNKGFLSVEDESESVSKTLEYSFNMACVSKIADVLHYAEIEGCQRSLELMDDAEMFGEYANAWRNLRDVQTGYMTPRQNGGWLEGFEPQQVNNHFTEANSWQYTFAVQHQFKDIENKALLSRLFNTSSKTSGREQADITGLIGQYAHGNEPSHHFAYLFDDIDSTAKYVKAICENFYTPQPDGLCGNEDCGQMSAWYVFSAMGLYPANPSTPRLVFGHMLFDSVHMTNHKGKTKLYKQLPAGLRKDYVRANSIDHFVSDYSYYYQYESAPFPKFQVCPSEVVQKPVYLSSPVFVGVKEVFKDSIRIALKGNNDWSKQTQWTEKIYYSIDGSAPNEQSTLYKNGQWITLHRSATIKAIAYVYNNSMCIVGISPLAMSQLHQVNNNYSIQILSHYNPQYTAGGPNGIIDGLKGDVDWRKGRWQGYQGQDFVAIVDMQKTTSIDTVIIGFLEDRRSWIFAPSFVEIFGSNDGVNFVHLSAGDYLNQFSQEMTLQRSPFEFYLTPGKHQYRYLKVVATNYGKLPAWHQGSGGDAFIFVDEIEIR